MKRVSGWSTAFFVATSFLGACGDRPGGTVDRKPAGAERRVQRDAAPDADETPPPGGGAEAGSARGSPGPEASAGGQPEESAARRAAAKRAPRRPADSWVIFREAFDARKDATCETTWVGRNRFRIQTRNIKRLTVDLRKLPRGAPRTGPWVLLLDGQGVEITGFKPKKGYTGLKRDLVRSRNGRWTVDRRRLYRPGE